MPFSIFIFLHFYPRKIMKKLRILDPETIPAFMHSCPGKIKQIKFRSRIKSGMTTSGVAPLR